jgi:hypothetical protein
VAPYRERRGAKARVRLGRSEASRRAALRGGPKIVRHVCMGSQADITRSHPHVRYPKRSSREMQRLLQRPTTRNGYVTGSTSLRWHGNDLRGALTVQHARRFWRRQKFCRQHVTIGRIIIVRRENTTKERRAAEHAAMPRYAFQRGPHLRDCVRCGRSKSTAPRLRCCLKR